MPLIADPYPASYPPWLKDVLNTIGTSPVGTELPLGGMTSAASAAEPELASIGKRISDLLGTVFRTEKPTGGTPQRLRLTNWDARSGNIELHPVVGTDVAAPGTSTAGYHITPADLDALINKGKMSISQPPEPAVARLQKILSSKLGP